MALNFSISCPFRHHLGLPPSYLGFVVAVDGLTALTALVEHQDFAGLRISTGPAHVSSKARVGPPAAKGCAYEPSADLVGTSRATVKFHLANARGKLDAKPAPR